MTLDSNADLPKVRELPLYKQLNNACGLASILMLVNPPQNPRISQFLSDIYNIIAPLVPMTEKGEKEFQHQYALEYLLLKAQGTGSKAKQSLYEYLDTRFRYGYEDQKIINNHLLSTKKEKFLALDLIPVVRAYDDYILGTSDYITSYMLEDEIHTMKTDIELKMLLELLGFRYMKHATGDVTGAISLDPQNYAIALTNLIGDYIHTDRIMLFGSQQPQHWMAVSGMFTKNMKYWRLKEGKIPSNLSPKEVIFIYNDPLAPIIKQIPMKDLENCRFYTFEDRKENLRWLWNEFLAAIKNDVEIERNVMKDIDSELTQVNIKIDAPVKIQLEQLRLEETKKTQNIIEKHTSSEFSTKVRDSWSNVDDGWIKEKSEDFNYQAIKKATIQKGGTSEGEKKKITEDEIFLEEKKKKLITEKDVFEEEKK